MKMRIIGLCAATALLAACGGGDTQSVDFSAQGQGQLYYSYPADQQQAVSIYAPVVLQFSEPQSLEPEAVHLTGPDGEVAVAVSLADGGSSLVITPAEPLAFNSDYQLQLDGVTLGGLSDGVLDFSTGIAAKGPLAGRQQQPELVLTRQFPAGGEAEPLMDFSALRLQFSQPLARTSVDYGHSVSLRDGSDNLVAAAVLVNGRHLTIDPLQDLTPGASYTLNLDSALHSVSGQAFSGQSEIRFTPRDSEPRSTLVLEAEAADPVGGCHSGNATLSQLNDAPVNCVPLIAKLLGDSTVSMLSGDVYAQLGFVPDFPDAVPLRIRKGSLLQGAPLDVMIGGHLPAGFDSGAVTVSFLADANGYMTPAPYSDHPDAPRRVMMSLDLAFSTEDSRANGAFTQTLLQVDLVGRALVEEGRLTIDAIGVIEPEVLGIETAFGVLSFHMASYQDQQSAPPPAPDISGPLLQSWQPGDYADRFRPGDPVVLNLSETPDQDSIDGNVTLTQAGVDVPFSWRLDGASLILTPNQPLAFDSDYQVAISDGIEDLSGNPATPWTGNFAMPHYSSDSPRSPFTTTVYPGFPCATDRDDWDLPNGFQGRCKGDNGSGDILPVPPLPANRSIEVQFSQDMDPASLVLGGCGSGTVRVVTVNPDGSCKEAVPGELSVDPRSLRFTPQQPWQSGELYKYVLASEQSASCGVDAVCSAAGLPLQAAQLQGPARDEGGPNLAIAFQGAPATDQVLLPLRNLPKADVNANFALDSGESGAVEDPPGSGQYPTPTNAAAMFVTGVSGLATDAKVGCPLASSCPGDKFTFLNGGINADIVGWNDDEQAVEVDLYPPALMTTSSSVFAEILGLVESEVPTQPLVMRGRYADDGSGVRRAPIKGWIRCVKDLAGACKTPGELRFETTLDLFLDAPEMVAPLGLPHNLHSYPLNGLELEGPVEFLPDGRLVIGLLSLAAQPIKVSIGGGAAVINLEIPVSGVNLTYQSGSIKKAQ